MKKYKLDTSKKGIVTNPKTKEEMEIYQIEALIDIPSIGVKVGDKGGFIQGEQNLSHEHDCWVFDTSIVADGSFVGGSAIIQNGSKVVGSSRIFNSAISKSGIYNSLIGDGCNIESSQIAVANCYGGATISDSEVTNVTLWNANIKDSFLKSKKSHIWIHDDVTFQMLDSRFIHTGARPVKIEHSFSLLNTSISNIRTFTLKSPLRIKNVHNLGVINIGTLKNDDPDFINELSSSDKLVCLSKSKVVLKDSAVKMEGYIGGHVIFDKSNIETLGSVRAQKKGRLHLKNVKMMDMSSVEKRTGWDEELKNIVLLGEDFYEC